MNEGFKKIYNFTKLNEKGDQILKYRNNSFWIKNIKPIIYNDIVELIEDYDEVTQKLNEFLNFNFNTIKENRDLSVHYDKNPLLIYRMIISLDLEKELQLIIKFMDILDEMYFFTEKLCFVFLLYIDKSENELADKIAILGLEIKNLLNEEL